MRNRFKRILGIIVAACIAVSVFTLNVSAADLFDQGSEVATAFLEFANASDWETTTGSAIEISAPYASPLYTGATLSYDIEVDDAEFEGALKIQSVIKGGDPSWAWVQCDNSQIVELDNSTLKKQVEVVFGSGVEKATTLGSIVVNVAGYNTDFNGKVTISNLKLVNGEPGSDSGSQGDEIFNGGDKTVDFGSVQFDLKSDWHDLVADGVRLDALYDGAVYPGAKLVFTVAIDSRVSFSGAIKPLPVLRLSNSWSWTQCPDSQIANLTASSFENGEAQVTVVFDNAALLELADLKAIDFKVAGWQCDYAGTLSIKNVVLHNGEEPSESSQGEEIYNSGDKVADFENVKFDPTADWSDVLSDGVSLNATYTGVVYPGAKLVFKVEIDPAKTFTGLIKPVPVLRLSDSWSWTQAEPIPELLITDFTNGIATVEVIFDSSAMLDTTGLAAITFKAVGTKCDYDGYLKIKEVVLYNGDSDQTAPELPSVEAVVWDFNDTSKGIDGWIINEGDRAYDYSGESSIEYDSSTFDSGVLKFNVDFSANSSSSWSEAKMYNTFASSLIELDGYNLLSFDFYYNPSLMTKGSFSSQIYISSSSSGNKAIPMSGESVGDFIKTQATISIPVSSGQATQFMLSVVGASTDYKGPVYFDNVTLGQTETAGVLLTETPEAQTPVDISELPEFDEVSATDKDATDEALNLFAYLKGISGSGQVIFGHENDTHHKAGGNFPGSTTSDTADLTGSIAGVAGIDTLSLIGNEYPGKLPSDDPRYDSDPVKGSAKLSIDAFKQGAIVSLSAHMPNFSLVYDKGQKDGAWDFSGYTVNDHSGNPMERILPGGDLNEVYVAYLDIVAEYLGILQEEKVPVVFRPFHENNGSWFWWGSGSTPENFKSVFRYTIDYLRESGIHNFIVAYSPNGPFSSEAAYLERYPGDEYIDVIAYDYYQNGQSTEASSHAWINGPFANAAALVKKLADEKGKIAAISELGIITGTSLGDGQNWGCLAETGNKNLDWFSDALEVAVEHGASYMLAWADFDPTNFDMTYRISETKGHEMANGFIKFYNDERTVFADGTSLAEALAKTPPTVADLAETAYFLAPVDGTNLVEPIQLIAKASPDLESPKFVLESDAGEEATLDAVLEDGLWVADLEAAVLEKFVGPTTISLYSAYTVIASIAVVFGEIPEKPAGVVDDFELYQGSAKLLADAWVPTSGSNCSNQISLVSDQKSSGEFGLKYEYHIQAPPEGYTGITLEYSADVSEYNALQLWIKPDGYGQKLVIQVTSGSEDFEVFLSEFAATTEAKLVTIPFSKLVGKNGGTFNPARVSKVGLWVNTIPSDEEWSVDSVFYFDNIHFLESDAEEITFEDLPEDIDEDDDASEGTAPPAESSPARTYDPDAIIQTSVSSPRFKSGESVSIVIGASSHGVDIKGSDLQLGVSKNVDIVLKNYFFQLSLSPAFAKELAVPESSNARILLHPATNPLPKAEFDRIAAIDPINQTLLKRVFNFSVQLASGVASVSAPIKASVDVSSYTDAQKSRLTGVFYDKASKSYRQLGGELSEDGKTFVFYSSKQGLLGLIISDKVTKLEFSVGSKAYSANGTQAQSDAAPFVGSGSETQLSLRAVADALGANVSWIPGTRTVAVAFGSKTVRFTIGQPYAIGAPAPVIKDDRAFAPIEQIAYAFGANIVIIGETVKIYL
ncbi:MAG: hypothetical protein LBT59_20985 [Clostridiales bacterium]|nr:hypothetical protein [Clostridiales bacterium]